MNNQFDPKDLEKVSFKTAFKATMGFYAAQFVSTLLGLLVIGTVITSCIAVVKHL